MTATATATDAAGTVQRAGRHRPDHRDHFHCDTNQGRGRITRGLATLRFVQEALGDLERPVLVLPGVVGVVAVARRSGRDRRPCECRRRGAIR